MKRIPKNSLLLLSICSIVPLLRIKPLYAAEIVGTFSANQFTTHGLAQFNSLNPVFPGCSALNDDWIMQSGPDFVQPIDINKNIAVIKADQITGQEKGMHYAEGDVVGYKDDKTFLADWLVYDQRKSHATGGNVIVSRQYDVMSGAWVDYYLNLDTGLIENAHGKNYQSNLSVDGAQIKLLGKDKYQVIRGSFTSCDPDNPSWSVHSSTTNFDYQDNQGTAHNAVLYAHSVPIFYTPYMQFPLGRRKSGFLAPQLGSSGAGFFVGVPYYWNMAPNYDMTITPRYYTASGVMLTDQFRYLTETGSGDIYTEQMPDFLNFSSQTYRYYWSLDDTHQFLPHWTTGYKYNSVSDNNYFVDFGSFSSLVNNINLEQSVYTKYQPDWGTVGIRAQAFQVLQPVNQPPSSPVYEILPQIDFDINPQKLGVSWLQLGLTSQYTDFTSGGGLQAGQRTVEYPALSIPFKNEWGYVTPKIGYSMTQYQIEPFPSLQNYAYQVYRNLPIASIDSGLTFERPFSAFHSDYIQTLEPRLYYLYIPDDNQGSIPAFDTGIATPNLNQLFSENWFTGFDRVNRANDLTMGLTSRILNANSGDELAKWGIGYRYRITSYDATIYGNYNQFAQLYQPTPNLIAELGNKWRYNISTNLGYQYDTNYNTLDAYSIKTSFSPEEHKVLNLGYTYQYNMPLLYYAWVPGQQYATNFENQYALTFSGQWPLFSKNILFDFSTSYDFTQSRYQNYLAGLEYDGGCWAIQGLYEGYMTGYSNVNTNQVAYNNTFMLQFVFKGLTSINYGGNPLQDSSVQIPGYMPLVQAH